MIVAMGIQLYCEESVDLKQNLPDPQYIRKAVLNMDVQMANDPLFFEFPTFKITSINIPGDRALPHSSGYHYHDADELLIVKSGVSSICIGDSISSIDGSYIVYFKNNVPHSSVALPSYEYSRLCLSVDESYFSTGIKLPTESFVMAVTDEELESLLAPAELLYKYFSDCPKQYSPVMFMRREHLLKLLLDEIKMIIKSRKESVSFLRNSYITKVCEYLTLNFNKKISLSQISDDFFVSKAKLTRDFKNKCGISICDYIATLRVRNAKNQLANTDLPIWKIAENCGYQSSGYFIQQFAKAVGQTPVQYRKNLSFD